MYTVAKKEGRKQIPWKHVDQDRGGPVPGKKNVNTANRPACPSTPSTIVVRQTEPLQHIPEEQHRDNLGELADLHHRRHPVRLDADVGLEE